ncbi:hypothetical protein [Fulvivirga lutea]|uniref:YtxH domain-containing protein n=1 Tax=Fulvivirga lutea TaxID=2810512 RepID=A0A975A2N3_9BACT|nr:hypothetical protein [Fulvivirga lutea]QSE99026.1 hypothetical protein JR347_08050 [Fulvivirga lutea]
MGRRPEGKAEHLFKNLGKKIDELISDIKKGTDDPRFKDRFEELKRNGEKLKTEFNSFKDDHHEIFDDIDKSFEKAGEEIRKAFSETFRKGSKNKKEA